MRLQPSNSVENFSIHRGESLGTSLKELSKWIGEKSTPATLIKNVRGVQRFRVDISGPLLSVEKNGGEEAVVPSTALVSIESIDRDVMLWLFVDFHVGKEHLGVGTVSAGKTDEILPTSFKEEESRTSSAAPSPASLPDQTKIQDPLSSLSMTIESPSTPSSASISASDSLVTVASLRQFFYAGDSFKWWEVEVGGEVAI